jgi:hypothetical protein
MAIGPQRPVDQAPLALRKVVDHGHVTPCDSCLAEAARVIREARKRDLHKPRQIMAHVAEEA